MLNGRRLMTTKPATSPQSWVSSDGKLTINSKPLMALMIVIQMFWVATKKLKSACSNLVRDKNGQNDLYGIMLTNERQMEASTVHFRHSSQSPGVTLNLLILLLLSLPMLNGRENLYLLRNLHHYSPQSTDSSDWKIRQITVSYYRII